MTPEQVGGRPVTPASDIFSLGSLGAYAATGRLPFDAPNSAAMMHRVLHEAPELDGIPAGLRQLLESCLAKEPADRPTPAQVLDRCRALMPDAPSVFPQSWGPDAGSGRPGLSDAAALPTPPETVPSAAESQPTLAPVPRQGPPAAAWLMVGVAVLAVVALGVGLATLPSLRTTIGHQHPGATAAAVASAAKLAAAAGLVRALTTGGAWLWAARDIARGHRSARAAAHVALAVSTLGLVSSYTLGLATTPVQALALAGWVASVAAVALLWPRRHRGRRQAERTAG